MTAEVLLTLWPNGGGGEWEGQGEGVGKCEGEGKGKDKIMVGGFECKWLRVMVRGRLRVRVKVGWLGLRSALERTF